MLEAEETLRQYTDSLLPKLMNQAITVSDLVSLIRVSNALGFHSSPHTHMHIEPKEALKPKLLLLANANSIKASAPVLSPCLFASS